MNPGLKKLTSSKLTRKEFLLYVGAVFIGISGISSLLKLVTDVNPKSKSKAITNFGGGPYGL